MEERGGAQEERGSEWRHRWMDGLGQGLGPSAIDYGWSTMELNCLRTGSECSRECEGLRLQPIPLSGITPPLIGWVKCRLSSTVISTISEPMPPVLAALSPKEEENVREVLAMRCRAACRPYLQGA